MYLMRDMNAFREIYCARLGLPPSDFEHSVFRRSLYGHVRYLMPLLLLVDSDFFAVDFEFIRGLGAMTSRRDLATEVDGFRYHPANSGFLRRTLRLRVSVEKTRQIFEHHVQAMERPVPRAVAR
jgi:hypothetical protein